MRVGMYYLGRQDDFSCRSKTCVPLDREVVGVS